MKLHWSIPVVTASAIFRAALYFSVPGHADPITQPVINYTASQGNNVCASLDDSPTLPRVTAVLDAIQRDSGFPGLQTAQVLVLSVNTYCPRHEPLLQRYVDTYAGPQPSTGAAAGAII